MIRVLELSVASPDLPSGREVGLEIEQSAMATALINHACVLNSLKNPKGQSLESFQVDGHVKIQGE